MAQRLEYPTGDKGIVGSTPSWISEIFIRCQANINASFSARVHSTLFIHQGHLLVSSNILEVQSEMLLFSLPVQNKPMMNMILSLNKILKKKNWLWFLCNESRVECIGMVLAIKFQ